LKVWAKIMQLGPWFPNFSASWTLLTISLKAVDPLNKTSQYCYLQVVSTRKGYHLLLLCAR